MRLNNIILLLLIGLNITLSHAEGGEGVTLTLEECRSMALENNYNLKSADENISIQQDMLAAYRTNHLPNISLSGNYLYSTASFSESIEGGYLPTFVPDASGELVPNLVSGSTTVFNSYAYMPDINFDFEVGSLFNAGAQILQPIYLGGRISTAVKLAQIGVNIAESQRRLSEAEVILNTDEAFYNYLKIQELLLSAESYEAVVKELYRNVESALNNGMARRNDLLKVEVKLGEARLQSQRARNGVVLARMNLCYAVGLPLATPHLALSDEFSASTEISADNLDITARPEYSMLEQQMSAKELEVKLSRSEFLPSVSAIASYSYLQGAKLNNQTLFGSASFSGGVMVNVPIFHWGEGRRKRSASRSEVTIAQNQLEDLSQLMTLELLQSINSYNEAVMEVEMMSRNVVQAEENMRLSNNHYSAGMESIADLLEAQALWQKSLSDLLEARARQRIAYTIYLKAVGESI